MNRRLRCVDLKGHALFDVEVDIVAGRIPVADQALADLGFAELLAFPLLLLLALLIFRGLAALLPLAVGSMSVMVTFVVLRLINMSFPLSSFALNLVIGLGLGLAVDYSLFFVARFREQLALGLEVGLAMKATVVTTGRTVIFSALTVAAADHVPLSGVTWTAASSTQ